MTGIAVHRVHSRWLGVVVAALLLTPVPVAAQGPNTLRGRVIDETSRPVSFAQIAVLPGDRRIVTDQNGDFSIAGLTDGQYELRVRRIGYAPGTVQVRIPGEQRSVTITLIPLPRVLDSVRIRERSLILRYTGIVLDDLNEPVVGAEVIAAGASDLDVRTDSAGHFRLAKPQKGMLVLRIRKFGYTPYFGSLTFSAEREDTIRVKRHPQDLPEAYIRIESGFGRDTFAYVELDSRMRWKVPGSGVASREDLDRWGDMDLCQALMRTPAAASMELRESHCPQPQCIIIDGLQPVIRPLNTFLAAEVEAVEFHRRDLTGTINSRKGVACSARVLSGQTSAELPRSRTGRVGRTVAPPTLVPGGQVIWMRRRP